VDGIITFPRGFLWGASTASYQNEGGNTRSALWDWEAKKKWERSADAADAWNRFDEDLAIIQSLHLNAYRFSLEWSRVEPEPGRFDEQALARYAEWARKLKEAGIRPFVCFHHFSEPAWLLKKHPKGWADAETVKTFMAYVRKAAPFLQDWVSDWVVFNEPMPFLIASYGAGFFPPGRFMLTNPHKVFIPVVVRNMAAATVEAAQYLHGLQKGAKVGIAHHVTALEPAATGDDSAVRDWDWFFHRNFLDQTAVYLDFLGVNYYTRVFVHRTWLPFFPMGVIPGYAEFEKGLTPLGFRLLGGRRGKLPRTAMNWEVAPEGFGKVVYDLWRDYRKPVLVLENGLAESKDAQREPFLRAHLASLAGAMSRGADVRGYFHWTLLDNWEWGSFKPKFGLYTRDRKKSSGADFYAQVAKTGELRVAR
jgi:beta-glucosidase